MAGCILIIDYPDIIAGIWMKLKMRMDGTENARCKNIVRECVRPSVDSKIEANVALACRFDVQQSVGWCVIVAAIRGCLNHDRCF